MRLNECGLMSKWVWQLGWYEGCGRNETSEIGRAGVGVVYDGRGWCGGGM